MAQDCTGSARVFVRLQPEQRSPVVSGFSRTKVASSVRLQPDSDVHRSCPRLFGLGDCVEKFCNRILSRADEGIILDSLDEAFADRVVENVPRDDERHLIVTQYVFKSVPLPQGFPVGPLEIEP